jgi:hypothetical protein
MGENRNVYKSFVKKPEGKRPTRQTFVSVLPKTTLEVSWTISYTDVVFLKCTKSIAGHNLKLYLFFLSHPFQFVIQSVISNSPPPPNDSTAPWGPRPPHFSRLHDHTFRHTTLGRTPLDKGPARRRDLYLTTHNTHNRQTSMSRWDSNPQSQ